jgi:hypothetical protein
MRSVSLSRGTCCSRRGTAALQSGAHHHFSLQTGHDKTLALQEAVSNCTGFASKRRLTLTLLHGPRASWTRDGTAVMWVALPNQHRLTMSAGPSHLCVHVVHSSQSSRQHGLCLEQDVALTKQITSAPGVTAQRHKTRQLHARVTAPCVTTG